MWRQAYAALVVVVLLLVAPVFCGGKSSECSSSGPRVDCGEVSLEQTALFRLSTCLTSLISLCWGGQEYSDLGD